MTLDRRAMLAASIGLGAATAAAAAPSTKQGKPVGEAFRDIAHDIVAGLKPNATLDQTAALQTAIDSAAERGAPVVLPAGTFRIGDLRLRAGTKLIGQARTTILEFVGGDAFITADKADGLVVSGLVLDGAYKTTLEERGDGLLSITRARDIQIEDLEIRHGAQIGISLTSCSGRINNNKLHAVLDAGIKEP